jgi:hypothetical protein
LLSASEIGEDFFTPLAGLYYVVAVGIYPGGRQSVNVKRNIFRLTAGSETIKAAHPIAVLRYLAVAARPEPGLHGETYAGETITFDAGTGRKPSLRTGTYGGGGIANGRYLDQKDMRRIELELRGRGLPEGTTTTPVAGYLFFPINRKKSQEQAGGISLEIRHAGRTTKLDLASADAAVQGL